MRLAIAPVLLVLSGWWLHGAQAAPPTSSNLTVRTLTGVYTGQVNKDFPTVREFRSIQYGQAPVGKRRWAPPVAVNPNAQHHYSYRFPSACSQYLQANYSVWNSNITDSYLQTDGQGFRPGAMAQTSSEDCLYLAAWTPLSASPGAKLPVIIFVHGGSFERGGVIVPYQQPAPFVALMKDAIAVVIQYRVNMMGFPNSAALEDQNLAILDIRLAVEWIYSNIASFGGDPERMTLWGQSAGSVAVDIYNYAYYDNPLVKGYFLMSGTAAVQFNPPDPTYANFTFLAKKLGCDFPDDAEAELDCMRGVPVTQLMNWSGQYADNGTSPKLQFRPVPDDKIVFNNYSARAKAGKISKLPAIVSTTANEFSSLHEYPLTNLTEGPWQQGVNKGTLETFVCPSMNTTNWRVENNLTTYRYQYAGNFSSLTPLSWMGAYHASDIPVVMGTYVLRGNKSDLLVKASEMMQDYLYAFMLDPENGPKNKGWNPQTTTVAEGGPVLRVAAGDKVEQTVSSLSIDNACLNGSTYDYAPE